MTITINDKPIVLSGGASLQDALNLAGIAAAGTATAVNNEVVAAPERAEYKLKDGDKVLIIKAFYGG